MSLPSQVQYFMQRMQGVSSSHFKINPQTDGTHSSGKIIRFLVPENTLWNTRATRLFFSASCAGHGTNITPRLPNDISSLIERVSVYMGGVLVQQGFQGYNSLKHAKAAVQGSKCNPALGHPEIVRTKSYHNGATFAGDASEAYAKKDDQFCIDYWEGFLGSVAPEILDTGLYPAITIEITLADDAVCPVSEGIILPTGAGSVADNFDKKGAAAATYSLSNMSMQVEVLNFATNALDAVTEQRISSVGYLSLPFKNYTSYSSTHTNSSRANVASASFDRLWCVWRPTDYATFNAPVIVNGYKKAGAFVSIAAANDDATNFDVGVPAYDTGGALDTNKEKYIAHYFNYKLEKANANAESFFQLQVNSANIPAYRMNVPEVLAMTQNSVDMIDRGHKLTLDQYKNNYFVNCYRFCLPEADFNRMASGLDTRNQSANIVINTENVGNSTSNLTLFAETTAELRVGSAKNIEVIF
jgi:hypothetical protein